MLITIYLLVLIKPRTSSCSQTAT